MDGKPDTIEPALNREENVVLDSLLRVGTDVTLELSATLSMDQGLDENQEKPKHRDRDLP